MAGIAAATVLATVVTACPARASGLFVTDRGVRPLGRGGAFVAGADDLGAIAYNPAGLADVGSSVLVDASWVDVRTTYTRRMRVVDAAGREGVQTFAPVSGTTAFMPIPTLAVSLAPLRGEPFTVAIGAYAPNAALLRYPEDAGGGAPSPSRYSLVSLEGSALVIAGLWAAYRPVPALRIGMGLQALVGKLASTAYVSANPDDRFLGAAEDARYDARTALNIGPIFAPSFSVGAVLAPWKSVRIGLAAQAPFVVNAPATVDVRLPGAPVFDDARQEGSDARAYFRLPAVLRAGVEVRPLRRLRVELAYVRELWAVHGGILVAPSNVQLRGVTGLPSPFAVSPLAIRRGFENADSFRLGGEYTFDVGRIAVDARAGVSFDRSAIPRAFVSPLTVDADKVVLAAGAGIHATPALRIDVTYAHAFFASVTVSPDEAAVPRLNAVGGSRATAGAVVGVNGGTYGARANVVGLGVEYRF